MQRRPRVLAVAQSAEAGGAELALQRLAAPLSEHGFDVELATPPGGSGQHELSVGALRAGSWVGAVTAWPRARALSRRFDLVLLNGIVTQRLAPAMTKGPPPVGVSPLHRGDTATLVPYIHELAESNPRAWSTQRFWRAAPVVLCACEAVAQRCRARGAPPDRRPVVYAPGERVEAAPKPAWRGERPVAGFVGRIEAHKGTLDLVRAVRSVDADLVIVGDGEGSYAERVRGEADATFVGRVADARALMPWFDVLAVPSHSEAFGTVAAEALAAGTPVVATRGGGIEEYVVPGRNGALVMPGDVEALASALNDVLPKAAAYADAARADAQRFATARVADAVAAALRDALAMRGRA